MASSVTIDLRQLGRGLNASLRQIQSTVELLDEGNTVPFITRYRKDHTGGLDEEQIREIHDRLTKMRLLADRKQTVLRSIESQGKLTDDLAAQILAATTAKRLEDLYLPYKPKKQTLATLARSRGLESLAREIYEAAPSCANLDARAADFVNADRQVPTAADALLGAGHILAEQISEQAELRQQLREILQRTGVLVSNRLPPETKPAEEEAKRTAEKPASPAAPKPAGAARGGAVGVASASSSAAPAEATAPAEAATEAASIAGDSRPLAEEDCPPGADKPTPDPALPQAGQPNFAEAPAQPAALPTVVLVAAFAPPPAENAAAARRVAFVGRDAVERGPGGPCGAAVPAAKCRRRRLHHNSRLRHNSLPRRL